jgi:hypothetical protein
MTGQHKRLPLTLTFSPLAGRRCRQADEGRVHARSKRMKIPNQEPTP